MWTNFILIAVIGILLVVGIGFYLYCRKITLGEMIFMFLMDMEQTEYDEYHNILSGDNLVDYLTNRYNITRDQAAQCVLHRHNRDFFDEQPWLTIDYNGTTKIGAGS